MMTPHDPFHAFVFLETGIEPGNGPLAGLSYAVKDLVSVAGRAPTCGLAEPPYPAAPATAPVISLLDRAGAMRRGFTEMPPLAYEASGANPNRVRPENPWNRQRICGGSSSGSAVAVCAGQVDFALGTDTAGSLRIPAHCCGIAAWKPSPGVIDPAGTVPLAPSLDSIGFLARTPRTLFRVAKTFIGNAAGGPLRRMAIARDCLATPGADRAVSSVTKDLEMLGIGLVDTALTTFIKACDEPLFTVLDYEASACHAALWKGGRLDPILTRRLEKGAAISTERYEAARAALQELAGEALEAAFAGTEAILLPILSIDTPLVEQCDPQSASFSGRTLYALSKFTRFVNAIGLPAVAFPAAYDGNHMPVAVQIVGRRGSDAMLLELAAGLELGWSPGSFTPPDTGSSSGVQT